MKSDCDDSTTLEENEAEVFDYSYGDIVRSRIQWFEQLKGQVFAPKPVTDVWSVPNHIPGVYGQKIQMQTSTPTIDRSSGEEIASPQDDNIESNGQIQDGPSMDSHHQRRKSVQFEVNVGQDQQDMGPADLGSISEPVLNPEPRCLGGSRGPLAVSEPIPGPGLLKSPMLVNQVNKADILASGKREALDELQNINKGQS